MNNNPLSPRSPSGVLGSAPLLGCHVEDEGGIAVIHCSGELDMSTAPILRAELARLADPARHVIVDLSDVVYCDMSGIRLLEDHDNLCGERGCMLVTVIPPGIVRRVFEIIEAPKMLRVADTREQARALLGGS
ncbi:MAG: STAS domain-containing protein [bacterium]